MGEMFLLTDAADQVRAFYWADMESRILSWLNKQQGGQAFNLVKKAAPPAVADCLEAYFSGDMRALDKVPVRMHGTPFQRQVWTALRTIPVGTTTSYRGIGDAIANPKAVRAIGQANGANPVAVIVPCHRVIAADGGIGGYAGGLARKTWLLNHEGAI
jgi:methylated-DNA-[protein]-cysteine S-methyltransferase